MGRSRLQSRSRWAPVLPQAYQPGQASSQTATSVPADSSRRRWWRGDSSAGSGAWSPLPRPFAQASQIALCAWEFPAPSRAFPPGRGIVGRAARRASLGHMRLDPAAGTSGDSTTPLRSAGISFKLTRYAMESLGLTLIMGNVGLR
jgi:hypothetical protein